MKDRHRARRALPDPADVLSLRIRVNVRDLFALIRDVNPTTGEDSPRERERYLLKSRLQSFLITSFADEVRAVPDATNLDLVLLEHRSGLEHACHAPLYLFLRQPGEKLFLELGEVLSLFIRRSSSFDGKPDERDPLVVGCRPARDEPVSFQLLQTSRDARRVGAEFLGDI